MVNLGNMFLNLLGGGGNPTQRMTSCCHSALVLIALLYRFCSVQEDRAVSRLIINGVCWIRHKLLSTSTNVHSMYTSLIRLQKHTQICAHAKWR